jgi:tetratricopeptide (TPR) repeat protein
MLRILTGFCLICLLPSFCATSLLAKEQPTIDYSLTQSELARKNYISLANSKYASGIIRNSIIDLAQNTTANLKNAVTYFDQGNTKYKLGDKKGAIADFDQAISINPKYAEAYYSNLI